MLVNAAVAGGADTYREVQYVSGKAGFTRKSDGMLIIDDKEIRFTDKKGGPVFQIAMADVVGARQDTQWREYPLSPGTREYLRIEARHGGDVETVVFRTARYQSAAMAAKIGFFREKAAGAPR